MQSDKTANGDLLWLLMAGGLLLGGIFTAFGLMLESVPMVIVGLIFLAFGGGALFTRLARR